MRIAALAVLGALAILPGASACSLAYTPFQGASFHDDGLWYIDGSALRHVDGARDKVVREGFFVSYARLDGDGLLVAGQDGLGGDCSGERWFDLQHGDDRRWSMGSKARVFAHPQGPFVLIDGVVHGFADDGDREADDLTVLHRVPEESWVLGFTSDGVPVLRANGGVQFGDRLLPLIHEWGEPVVAEHDGQLAVLEVDWGKQVVLHIVEGEQVSNVTWSVPEEWGNGLTWAGGWLMAVGGRAYLVTDQVTDLGVDGARMVAARGGHGVVFTDDGYVVFDGSRAVEAWERNRAGDLWRPAAVVTDGPAAVDATTAGPAHWVVPAPPAPTSGSDDALTIPGPPLAAAVAALAAVAFARRRRA